MRLILVWLASVLAVSLLVVVDVAQCASIASTLNGVQADEASPEGHAIESSIGRVLQQARPPPLRRSPPPLRRPPPRRSPPPPTKRPPPPSPAKRPPPPSPKRSPPPSPAKRPPPPPTKRPPPPRLPPPGKSPPPPRPPSPPPPNPAIAAGVPSIPAEGLVSVTRWTTSWQTGTIGTPVETYAIRCVKQGDPCAITTTPPISQVTNIPRSSMNGSIAGLQAGTAVTCYIVANNTAGEVCSPARTVVTGSIAPESFQGNKGGYMTAITAVEGSPNSGWASWSNGKVMHTTSDSNVSSHYWGTAFPSQDNYWWISIAAASPTVSWAISKDDRSDNVQRLYRLDSSSGVMKVTQQDIYHETCGTVAFSGVSAVDENTAWAFWVPNCDETKYPSYLKFTNDGGATWNPSVSRAELLGWWYTKIKAVSSSVVWVGGNAGKGMVTASSGQSWTDFQLPTNASISAIDAISDKVAVVGQGFSGTSNALWLTIDGGANWKKILENPYFNYEAVSIIGTEVIWASGYNNEPGKNATGFVVHSVDGGITFDDVCPTSPCSYIETGLAVVDENTAFLPGSPETPIFRFSVAPFPAVSPPTPVMPGTAGPPVISSVSADRVIFSWTRPDQAGVPESVVTPKCVAKGDPCSATALSLRTGMLFSVESVVLGLNTTFTEFTCYITMTNTVGSTCSEGTDITRLSIVPQTVPTDPQTPAGYSPIVSGLSASSANVAWSTAGGFGAAYASPPGLTTTGGFPWGAAAPASVDYVDIASMSDTAAFAIGWYGEDGMVQKLDYSSGEMVETSALNLVPTCAWGAFAISASSSTNAWAIFGTKSPQCTPLASHPSEVRMTEDGNTWKEPASGAQITTWAPTCIHAATVNIVWIGGTAGNGKFTNDGGDTWTDFVLASLPGDTDTGRKILTIHALSATVAYVGTASGRIYQTKDGGATWTEQLHIYGNINKISFANEGVGWAVGYAFESRSALLAFSAGKEGVFARSQVLSTLNGGQDWVRFKEINTTSNMRGLTNFGTNIAYFGGSERKAYKMALNPTAPAYTTAPGNPGAPTIGTQQSFGDGNVYWTASWTTGTEASYQELYTLKCVAASSACTAPAVAEVTGLSREARTAWMGILPGDYTCYVVATSGEFSVCSPGLDITMAIAE